MIGLKIPFKLISNRIYYWYIKWKKEYEELIHSHLVVSVAIVTIQAVIFCFDIKNRKFWENAIWPVTLVNSFRLANH